MRKSYKNYSRLSGRRPLPPHEKLRTEPKPGDIVLTIVGARNVAVTV